MAGQRAGLMIFLDQGNAIEESKKQTPFLDSKEEIKDLDPGDSKEAKNSARIYLNTLSSFTDNRAGSYALSSLKKMTGTGAFLEQTDEQKKCRIQTQENCQANNYLETIQNKCGCVPWELSFALPTQVAIYNTIINICSK